MQHFATSVETLEDAIRAEFPGADVTVAAGAGFTGSDPALSTRCGRAARPRRRRARVGEPSDLSGEAASRSDLRLPGDQEALVQAVADAGVPFVVVLENGRPLDVSGLVRPRHRRAGGVARRPRGARGDRPAPLGRREPGRPPADGIPPERRPGARYDAHERTGRPATIGAQGPLSMTDWQLAGPGNVAEHFTSKYLDLDLGPLLPFGHGLSTTRFALTDLRIEGPEIAAAEVLDGARIGVSVTVSNAGERDGDDVLLLFVRDEVASIAPAVRRLAGFERVTLPAGASQEVRLSSIADRSASGQTIRPASTSVSRAISRSPCPTGRRRSRRG